MRTPANPTKQFMTEILGALNQFFKKISKKEIQFQLPEQYSVSKKTQSVPKSRAIQKESKTREDEAQKMKILKKAFKRYREQMMKNESLHQSMKNLDEKGKKKRIKAAWKTLSQAQKIKWALSDKKKKAIANKLKAKSLDGKTSSKVSAKLNNQNKKE